MSAADALKAAIRAAGGIVHGDGNIFFTNANQFIAASLAVPAVPVPPGMQLVLVEPTPEMLQTAGPMDNYNFHAPGASPDEDHCDWWKAMLAASPTLDEQRRLAGAEPYPGMITQPGRLTEKAMRTPDEPESPTPKEPT